MLTDLANKNVFVTGAGGFLGRHLLGHLLACNANVTGLVRSANFFLPKDVRPARGDCRDAAAMKVLLQGQDIIIHVAGLLFGANWQAYLAANSESARNIAAAASGAERVILISSLAAAGPCALSPGRNESEAPAPVSAYGWSKLLAEQIMAAQLGEKLVILRPPIIYGSGDRGLLPLFKSAKMGIGIGPAKFPVSIIHVEDAARACALACKPEANGVYHLSDGKTYQMDDICLAMAQAQGRERLRMLRPPQALMRTSAYLSSWAGTMTRGICRLLGRQAPRLPAWNPDKYRESIQLGWLADNSRISHKLGFQAESGLGAGMAEAVAGYRKEGWL